MAELITIDRDGGVIAKRLDRREQQRAKNERAAFADNTLRSYKSAWTCFDRWCREEGVSALPAAPDSVADHLADIGESLKMATLRMRCAAITAVHFKAGYDDPCKTTEVRIQLKGLARRKAKAGVTTKKAEPLRLTHWHKIDAAFSSGSNADLRDKAIVAVLWSCLLRRSELAALAMDDLNLAECELVVAKSKTDAEGRGSLRNLAPFACAALRNWLDVRGDCDGHVFGRITRGGSILIGNPLSGQAVMDILRRALDRAGIDAQGFSGHSGRRGGAVHLANSGLGIKDLMEAGNWKSQQVAASYAVSANVKNSAAAQVFAEV